MEDLTVDSIVILIVAVGGIGNGDGLVGTQCRGHGNQVQSRHALDFICLAGRDAAAGHRHVVVLAVEGVAVVVGQQSRGVGYRLSGIGNDGVLRELDVGRYFRDDDRVGALCRLTCIACTVSSGHLDVDDVGAGMAANGDIAIEHRNLCPRDSARGDVFVVLLRDVALLPSDIVVDVELIGDIRRPVVHCHLRTGEAVLVDGGRGGGEGQTNLRGCLHGEQTTEEEQQSYDISFPCHSL